MHTAAIALACALATAAAVATVVGTVRADGQPPFPPAEGVTPPPVPETPPHPILALPTPVVPDAAKPTGTEKPADAAKSADTAKPTDVAKKPDAAKKLDAPRREVSRSRMCFNANETREKVLSHKLTDPMRAMRAGKLQGEALKARLCRWKTDEFVYEVSVLRKDGRLVHVYMNAQSGKTVSAQTDKTGDEHH